MKNFTFALLLTSIPCVQGMEKEELPEERGIFQKECSGAMLPKDKWTRADFEPYYNAIYDHIILSAEQIAKAWEMAISLTEDGAFLDPVLPSVLIGDIGRYTLTLEQITHGWKRAIKVDENSGDLTNPSLAQDIIKYRHRDNTHFFSDDDLVQMFYAPNTHRRIREAIEHEIAQNRPHLHARLNPPQLAHFGYVRQEQLNKEKIRREFETFMTTHSAFINFIPDFQDNAPFKEACEFMMDFLQRPDFKCLYKNPKDIEFYKKETILALELLVGREKSEIYEGVFIPNTEPQIVGNMELIPIQRYQQSNSFLFFVIAS